MSRKVKPNFGFFGGFWVLCLMLFSLVGAGGLIWVGPVWLDKAAVWRGPTLVEEVVIGPEEALAQASAPSEIRRRPPPRPDFEAIEERARSMTMEPGVGAGIVTFEGAYLNFPSGALPDGTVIEVAPVNHVANRIQDPELLPVGVGLRLRFDGRDHADFKVPVTVEMPFDLAAAGSGLKASDLVLTTYRDGRWERHRSSYDADRKVVKAQIRHASLVQVAVAVAAGSTVLFSETGRATVRKAKWAALEKAGWLTHSTHYTDHFAIHYSKTGSYAVTDDRDYVLAGRRGSGETPLFIQDVGVCLEAGYAGLPALGMPVGMAFPNRWSVFMEPLDAFGDTSLGGPIYLDKDYAQGSAAPPEDQVRYRLWATCIHELVHVAQDEYFTGLAVSRPWIEATAEYISNKLLEGRGIALTEKDYYIRSLVSGYLLERPFGDCQGDITCQYGYAYFFYWLDSKGYSATDFVKSVNQRSGTLSKISMDDVDRVLQNTRGTGLFGTWADFAADFYHGNLHSGAFTNINSVASEINNDFMFQSKAFHQLARVSGGKTAGGGIEVLPFVEQVFDLKPLTARHIMFTAGPLSPKKKAKLVVHALDQGGTVLTAGTHFFNSGMRANRTTKRVPLPLGRSPPGLLSFDEVESGSGEYFVTGRFTGERKEPGDSNVASVVLANGSRNRNARVRLRRWLLSPPKGLKWEWDRASQTAEVEWLEADLEKLAGNKAFKGYNVYRKPSFDAAADFPEQPLNNKPLTLASYRDTPPGGGDYIYGVTTVDVTGQESFIADPEEDPFEGQWEVKIFLVQGSVSKYAKREKVEEEDKESHEKLIKFIERIEGLARAGVPMTFEVSRKRGEYQATFLDIFFFPIDQEDRISMPFRRVGDHTLEAAEPFDKAQPIRISLLREDEINQVIRQTISEGRESETFGFRIKADKIENPLSEAERARKAAAWEARFKSLFGGIFDD